MKKAAYVCAPCKVPIGGTVYVQPFSSHLNGMYSPIYSTLVVHFAAHEMAVFDVSHGVPEHDSNPRDSIGNQRHCKLN